MSIETKTIKHGGYTIVIDIEPDEFAENPLESCDGMGKLHLFNSQADADEGSRILRKRKMAFSVQKYDHSAVHYSVAGSRRYPDMQWDVTLFAGVWEADKYFMPGYISMVRREGKPAARKWLIEQCNSILELYSNWCNGHCCGYVIKVTNSSGNRLHRYEDSCYGFYSSEEAMEQAEEMVKHSLLRNSED